MKKVIVLSRVSTSHQDLTQQTEEILREVHKDGYTDSNIIIIEDVESAIKLSSSPQRNRFEGLNGYLRVTCFYKLALLSESNTHVQRHLNNSMLNT